MARKNSRPLLVLGTAVLMAAAGCGSSSPGGGSGGGTTFEFGAMIPQSGTDSAVGEEGQHGIEMALAQGKKDGTGGDTTLKPIYRDNPGTPETAVTNFQKLTSINNVAFSFTTFSSATKAIAPLATSKHVVLLNPGATTTEFKNLSPYLFSDIPLGDDQAKAMLNYAYNQLHLKRLAGIYSNDAQGNGFKSVIPDYWRSLGGTYVGDGTVTTSDTNFGPVLTNIKSKSPDAVYIGFFGSGQGDLLKQGAQLNLNTAWLGSTSFANAGALKIAGDAAEGVYSTQVEPADTPAAKQFISDYKAKYGGPPPSFAQLFYSGTQVLEQAVKSVTDKHQSLTGPNLRDALLNGTFDTINGKMNFQKDGTVKVPIAITVYKNGEFTTLGTSDQGTFTSAGS